MEGCHDIDSEKPKKGTELNFSRSLWWNHVQYQFDMFKGCMWSFFFYFKRALVVFRFQRYIINIYFYYTVYSRLCHVPFFLVFVFIMIMGCYSFCSVVSFPALM